MTENLANRVLKTWLNLERELKHACAGPRVSLRTLGLSMVSHSTLLRGPGPLGVWSDDPKEQQTRTEERQVQIQTAIITAGLLLGFVVKTETGLEVR